LTNSGF